MRARAHRHVRMDKEKKFGKLTTAIAVASYPASKLHVPFGGFEKAPAVIVFHVSRLGRCRKRGSV